MIGQYTDTDAPAAEERICPHDGSILAEIGEEASEQLNIIPARIKIKLSDNPRRQHEVMARMSGSLERMRHEQRVRDNLPAVL